jgi:hypothetical protein
MVLAAMHSESLSVFAAVDLRMAGSGIASMLRCRLVIALGLWNLLKASSA